LIDIGLSLNLINKSGSWLSYGEERLGQGRENAKEFLKEHPETTLEIESRIRAMIQANQFPAAKPTADADNVTED
jgi:recombination protein RecA